MRRIYATIIVTLAFLVLAANSAAKQGAGADKLPPIGKRTYVIEGKASAPVSIRGDGAKAKVYLKDPVNPSAPIKLAPIKTKPKVVAKLAPRTERAGRMRFGKVSVSGYLRQPRVEFSRERLPLERADELAAPDFFQKVYEPAEDQDF